MAPERLPLELVIPELLFRLTVGGGVDELTRAVFGDLTSALERVVDEHLPPRSLGVCGTLEATYRIYRLAAEASSRGSAGEEEPASSDLDEGASRESPPADGVPERLTETAAARDSRHDSATPAVSLREEWPDLPPRLDWSEPLAAESTDETDLEPGDRAYLYDEWDRELGDFRSGWCRIVERSARRGGRQFVELVRDQYASLIASVRQQFQLLRPEALRKIRGEIDGEDFDLQAVIDHALDRRTGRRTSDRLYIRRLRKERDVAVSFLLDMSSSTARTVMRAGAAGPPRPAKRIIDIEKEGLVLMSEALEAVGDLYAVHGFTSEGRRNVRFYVVKDFQDRYGADVEARIGGITYQNNTRLGAAIRHSSRKLTEQDARTRLLIVLSDGRPYDHDYGDARYAREDTKVALREARMAGVTPFCITIDRESELQLRDLYGEVGYTERTLAGGGPARMGARTRCR
jgi:nitric oxide reductase activation protein